MPFLSMTPATSPYESRVHRRKSASKGPSRINLRGLDRAIRCAARVSDEAIANFITWRALRAEGVHQ